MKIFWYIFFIIIGYLSGSILWSKIIASVFYKKDIVKEHQDGNPGASNVFGSCGILGGTVALILDILKGFLPVFISLFFLSSESFLFSLVMISPVFGHIFPIFNKFRGGKAIAASFGVLIGISSVSPVPLFILAGLYVFFSVIVVFVSHMWRSVVTYVFFGLAAAFFVESNYITVACVLIALGVFLKHFLSRDKNEPISVVFLPILKKKDGKEFE